MMHALKVMVLLGMLTGCAGESAEVGRGDRPVRPSVPDDGTDTGELVFRLSDLGFVTTGSNVGRNLDGLDTTVADRAAECSAPSGATPRQDGPGGVDNAFGEVLAPALDLILPCFESGVQLQQSLGRGTLLLRVEGWNGGANDSAVTASLLVSADGTSDSLGDVMWEASTHQLVLTSDGTTPAADPQGVADDVYMARPDSFDAEEGATPRVRDTNAYLSNGTLVFSLPDNAGVPLNGGGSSLVMRLTDGLILAELSADFSTINAGSISGRNDISAFLHAAETVGVCPALAEAIEGQLGIVADVHSNPNAAEGGDCDAISVGIPFVGAPATLAESAGKLTSAGTNPPLGNACVEQDVPAC